MYYFKRLAMIVGLYPVFAVLLALVSGIIGLVIFYFIVKHAVRAGVTEAMREVLREFQLPKAEEKEE
jgi:hypothetical protein